MATSERSPTSTSTTTYPYVTLDVFTSDPFTGNPLAVVLVPSDLPPSASARQTIAREFNYSETVILHIPSRPGTSIEDGSTSVGIEASSSSIGRNQAGSDKHEVPTFRVNIHLVDCEVPLAGHPVIGTGALLFATAAQREQRGTLLHGLPELVPPGTTKARLLTNAGPVDLNYDPTTGLVAARIPHDVHLHDRGFFTLDDLLAQQPGLDKLDVATSAEAEVEIDTFSIVKGMTFVYVRLRNEEALRKVKLFSVPEQGIGSGGIRGLDEGWSTGVIMMMFYVDDTRSSSSTRRLRTRMIEGVFEDPATGSASCGLAALLVLRDRRQQVATRFELVQGLEIGRRSEIGVEVVAGDDGTISSVVLSGSARQIMSGRVQSP